jgi:hypothetical protein
MNTNQNQNIGQGEGKGQVKSTEDKRLSQDFKDKQRAKAENQPRNEQGQFVSKDKIK